MADEFKIEVDDREVAKALAVLGGRSGAVHLRRALDRIGYEHTRWMALKRFRKYTGRSPARGVQSRTGRLRRSLRHAVRGTNIADLTLRMFVVTPYAAIQEHGGDIRPVRRQYLTVPLKAALTPSGALSGRFRIRPGLRNLGSRSGASSSAGAFETDKGPTFIFRSRAGNLLVGIRNKSTGKTIKARGGAPKAFYVLKKEVHIPPRLGFRSEYFGHTRRFAVREIKQAGDAMVKEAGQ